MPNRMRSDGSPRRETSSALHRNGSLGSITSSNLKEVIKASGQTSTSRWQHSISSDATHLGPGCVLGRSQQVNEYEWESHSRRTPRSRSTVLRRFVGLGGAVVFLWAVVSKVVAIQ